MAVVVAAATIVLGLVVATHQGSDDPFADLRQVDTEDIPGALGFVLEPPPAAARPELTPEDVEARYPADGGEVQVAFASIRDTRLRDLYWRTREEDGGWNDRVFERSEGLGTAFAVLGLLVPDLPPPARWEPLALEVKKGEGR